MKISAKIDYAARALLALSLHWPNKVPMRINQIAQSQQIPIKFLTQILLDLKQMGYVKSVRGKNGGYLLLKSPQKIQLSGLIKNMGGIGYSVTQDKSGDDHMMDLIWSELDKTIFKAMSEIDFEMIADRKRKRDKAFFFQI